MNYSPFGSVPVPKKGRTNFNESHSVSGTFPLSKVVPVCFIDSLPGDSWKINAYNLTKLETLIAPAMQQVDASLLWFKMPKRLLFKHFKKWYTGGTDGLDDHQKPHIHLYKMGENFSDEFVDYSDASDFTEDFFGPGSLWSYLGLPCPLYYDSVTNTWKVLSIAEWDNAPGVDSDADFVDLLPLIGYNYIYDCYFRDQSLNDAIFEDSEEGNFTINKGFVWKAKTSGHTFYFGPASKAQPAYSQNVTSGLDLSEGGEVTNIADLACLLNLFRRAWRKDYFTSALPSPQRGPEVVLDQFADKTAPVSITGNIPVNIPTQFGARLSNVIGVNENETVLEGDVTAVSAAQGAANLMAGENRIRDLSGNLLALSGSGSSDNLSGTADLSGLSPISIVAFRNLFKLQAFLEKNNVAGGRYIESILAHWGERVPDFTVQRPQFIRATSLPVQISEITATANTAGYNSLVGDQAGRARTQGNIGSVRIYTQEPSFIFALYVVTAPPVYAGQGIPRFFQHITRYDEPWTDFQHIGEQAVKTRELFFPFEDNQETDTDFGYQQRYSEYKYMPDRVVGDFQSNMAFWHMARMFSSQPYLNGDFVEQHLDPRIFAVQSARPVTASFFFDAVAKRKLSKYSTPKIS